MSCDQEDKAIATFMQIVGAEVPSCYEVALARYKLIGIASLRFAEAYLQTGEPSCLEVTMRCHEQLAAYTDVHGVKLYWDAAKPKKVIRKAPTFTDTMDNVRRLSLN